MAFLDNSGDIILDAVLTETGRKRMATGNFNITKFAFGDDEIDYRLYNSNHRSGSAYYDLEILQTPIFEASTAKNAVINYGLVTLNNPNLLYMPVIEENEQLQESVQKVNNVYHVAVNDGQTYDALVTAFGGKGAGNKKVLSSGKTTGQAICLETGLKTSEIAATSANRARFITSQGLGDSSFSVRCDTRLIRNVMGPQRGTRFSNAGPNGEAKVNVKLGSQAVKIMKKGTTSKANEGMAKIAAINNNVVHRETDANADTKTSVLKGPRSAFTAINLDVKELTTKDFEKYGKTDQSIPGAAGKYDYIDTTVQVDTPIGQTKQLPVRIVKKRS